MAATTGSRAAIGAWLERELDRGTHRVRTWPGGSWLLGVILALGTVVGGLAAFLIVWAILVGWLA